MATQVERKRRRRRKEIEALLELDASTTTTSFRVITLPSNTPEEMHLIPNEASKDRLTTQHQFRQQHCKVRRAKCGGFKQVISAIHVRSSGGNNYCPIIKPRTHHFKMSTTSLLLSSLRATTTVVAFTTSIAILLLVNLIICPTTTTASTSAGVLSQPPPQSQPTTTNVIQAPGSLSKSRYRTMYACEDRQLNMDCEAGFKINLIRANFGRFSIQQCNEQGQLDLSIDCMSPNSFRIMNERCQGRQKCFVNATSAIFTDKCPKTRKYLEVHFQCQQDNETPRVDLRTTPSPHVNGGSNHQIVPVVDPPSSTGSSSSILPPNNLKQQPYLNPSIPEPSQRQAPSFNQQPAINTVINSDALGQAQAELKSIYTSQGTEQRLLVTFRHKHIENMRNPRCVLWDNSTWTDKGSYIYYTNYTHTTCAYDTLATSYLLVMDHVGPMQPDPTMQHQQPQPSLQPQPQPQLPPPASPLLPSSIQNQQQQPQAPINIGGSYPEILEQLVPIDAPHMAVSSYPQLVPPRHHSEPATAPASSMMRVVSLFGYVLAIVFAIVALTTIALVGSTMRSSASAALKSLGNFSAFNGGAKYKGSGGGGGGVVRRSLEGGNHNKDLLVINNQNGHQFLYAPAQTTKINSSSSTHILNAGTMPGQHQNTLHQIQQQQLYSGTNGTLSNLSGTGGQSNNYYYGLMGFNSLFQHQHQSQQLQHHLSQHHLNQQLQQQQLPQVSSYQHQANKSTVSNESANSSPSSSGVESGSTSVQQQQQSCLMMNNDYNLMSQLASYGQSNQQQAAMSQQQQQQPTLTLNAHYSSSGATPLLQSANQQRLNHQPLMNSPAAQLREHIYECVDDDKPYGARMLIPGSQLDDQLFNSTTLGQAMSQQQQQQRSMTLSSRLIQSAYQQQLQPVQVQQQQAAMSQNNSNNKRLFSHPAIIRDNQATKTNIICSKLAQVTPQRATEINKFQHDVMAIYNSNCDTTTTTTTSTAVTNSTGASSSCYGLAREDIIGQQSQQHQAKSKLSTDC